MNKIRGLTYGVQVEINGESAFVQDAASNAG